MVTIHRPVCMVAFGSAAVLVLACFVSGPSGTRADPATAQSPTAELANLRRERIATLRQATQLAKALYAQGACSAEEVYRRNQALMEAELEYAPSAAERIQILREMLNAAKKWEAYASEEMRTGTASGFVSFDAKAHRLQVEIQLAEEIAK